MTETPDLSARNRRIISGIIATMTPDHPKLDGDAHARVHADVTDFVGSQVQAMPSFLRLPYKLALTAFAYLPLLRYRKPFLALDAVTQARYLSSWSDARISVFRDFVKLIRSCAVLAYFDHPLVMQRLEAERHPSELLKRTALSRS